jgi:hypothetical protein
MTATQLQRMLDKAGLSQVGAARALGTSDRNMRRYASGELPIPLVFEMALKVHILNSGNRPVSMEDLSGRELQIWNDAVETARANIQELFIHCEPVRDKSNRFCELRVFNTQDGHLLCVVIIAKNGVPERVEKNPG